MKKKVLAFIFSTAYEKTKSIGEAGLSQESSMDPMNLPTNAKSILEFCHSAYTYSLTHVINILYAAAQSNSIGTDVVCCGGGSAYMRSPAKPIIQKYRCADCSCQIQCWAFT